jgi:acetyl esterase/lipase
MPDLLAPIRTARRHTVGRLRTIDVHTQELSYGPHDRHILSMWTPLTHRPSAGWPTLIMLHGGGWVEGSRHDFACLAPLLARRGIRCAAIDYRLAPADPWPAQQDDVHRAISVMQKAQNADPRRTALWGHSAGGHIALMAATQDPSLAAIVALGSPCDLEALPAPPAGVFPRGQLRSASPLHALKPDGSPILLVHGSRDRICTITQARTLAAAIPERCRLLEVRSGNHGLHWPPLACRNAKQAAVRWVSETLR